MIGNIYESSIRFIGIVKRYPCLYDTTRADYGQRHVQNKAWDAVSKEMGETTLACRDRWRNIRGCYLKYLNKYLASDSTSKPFKEYYLAQYLEFMDDFLVPRSHIPDNTQSKDADEQDSNEPEEELFSNIQEKKISPIDFNESSEEKQYEKKRKNKSSSKKKRIKAEKTLMEQVEGKRKKNIVDPDSAFLISILPDVKLMTNPQKRKFKVSVLKLADKLLKGSKSNKEYTREVYYVREDPLFDMKAELEGD